MIAIKPKFNILWVILIPILFGCSTNDETLDFESLCSISQSTEGSVSGCLGEFLLSIEDQAGEIKYSDNIGHYSEFPVDNTFDCMILLVICEYDDPINITGESILISGDVHTYTGNYISPVGGLKIFSLRNMVVKPGDPVD